MIENLEITWPTDFDAYDVNFTYNGVPCHIRLNGKALSASPRAVLTATMNEVAKVINEASCVR